MIRPGVDKSYWDCIVDGMCPYKDNDGCICPDECPNGEDTCSEYRRIKEVGYRQC